MQVNEQIDQFGDDTASVILVLTDGRLADGVQAYRQVSYNTDLCEEMLRRTILVQIFLYFPG